jgi:hypothetical protein
MMPAQCEYKLEESPGTDELSQYLNDESEEGWDLVTVIGGDGGRSVDRLVFRREVTNPTWDQ